MQDKIIKLFYLSLALVFICFGLFVYLAADAMFVERWHEKEMQEVQRITKLKRYEFDKMDFGSRGMQYEFKDGKFQLKKGVK